MICSPEGISIIKILAGSALTAFSGFFGLYASTKAVAYDRTEAYFIENVQVRKSTAEAYLREVNARHDTIFFARSLVATALIASLLAASYWVQNGFGLDLVRLFVALMMSAVTAMACVRFLRWFSSRRLVSSPSPLPSSKDWKIWIREEFSVKNIPGFLFGIWSMFLLLLATIGMLVVIPVIQLPDLVLCVLASLLSAT